MLKLNNFIIKNIYLKNFECEVAVLLERGTVSWLPTILRQT